MSLLPGNYYLKKTPKKQLARGCITDKLQIKYILKPLSTIYLSQFRQNILMTEK